MHNPPPQPPPPPWIGLTAVMSAGDHSSDLATPSYSRAAQGSSPLYLEGLEPGSGAFGAALAAAERASVTPARRVGRSFSQVSFCHWFHPQADLGRCTAS